MLSEWLSGITIRDWCGNLTGIILEPTESRGELVQGEVSVAVGV